MSRPTVSVYDAATGTAVAKQIPLPGVYSAPVRPDLVNFVHTQIAKNRRQAYAVDAERAGMQTAASSWGTGRAVSRIPRVPGQGTNRSGQGAFGNMCRKGRMFAPTRIWRRWHRKVSVNQRRYAVASAVAASGITPLVMARGHRVSNVPELPLVISAEANKVEKTKDAVQLLSRFGLAEDVDKVKESTTLRAGKGKMRGRRYVSRLGPLLVFSDRTAKIRNAVRNIQGLDTCHVADLNLLQLAPGGHMGRLVVWTADAFEKLDSLFGDKLGAPAPLKTGFTLPRASMTTPDVTRIVNSDEVQKVVRAKKAGNVKPLRKKNPLKNLGVMIKLNPYAGAHIRAEIKRQELNKKRKATKKAAGTNKKINDKKKAAGAPSRTKRMAFVKSLLQ